MVFEYTEVLKKSGLTESQAIVFEALLLYGEQKAGALVKYVPLKRTLVYKVLDDLVTLGLAEKKEESGEVARFLLKHPTNLRELVEGRVKSLKEAEQTLEGLIPTLTSQFNLKSGQPGVLVYEGSEGIERILADSLTSKTEVLTYADIDAIVKYIEKENQAYVKKRERLDVVKRGIVLDTPLSREYLKGYHKFVTDTHFLKSKEHPFQSVMMIYDDKISYLTLTETKRIGVIIADPQLYILHKMLFEFIWKMTEEKAQEIPDLINKNFS